MGAYDGKKSFKKHFWNLITEKKRPARTVLQQTQAIRIHMELTAERSEPLDSGNEREAIGTTNTFFI